METGSGSFRITMNAGDGRGTLASRFVDKQLGAGFQHLAFAAHDIVAAAHHLESRGAEVLDIPANYYADLVDKGEVTEPDAQDLNRMNMLLDRSGEDGRYYQIFSRAFDRRFFFEIVSRDQYRGFGSRNAPVRLAAQSRFVDIN
jgi:4-hydroxyphenylpyruvate dioxygenase